MNNTGSHSIEKFKTSAEHSSFDAYFFPYGLIKDPNLKKSDVYSHLQVHWKDEKSPAKIIQDLASFQQALSRSSRPEVID